MRAMILAAGRGKRLSPLTDHTPKPLVEIAGKPLLVYHLERLSALGIKEIVINVAYLAEKIIQTLGDGSQFGVNIHYSVETEPLETAGGIINALPLLGDAPFLLVNGDIWTDYPFQQLMQHKLSLNKLAHLVLVPNLPKHPTGDFGLIGNRLLETAEQKFTYSGIALYSPQFFHGQPAGVRPMLPLLKQAIIEDTITAELYTGEWYDVGTVACWQQLNERLHGSTPQSQQR